MKSLIKYIKAKNIEKIFKELCEEFDSCINSLPFSIDVNIDDELEQLKADQVDLLNVRLKKLSFVVNFLLSIKINYKLLLFNNHSIYKKWLRLA
jgi:hypothetical protein